MSDSLRPHRLQHARLPCPSPTPRACSNSGPLSQWCHPTISSPVFPFSYCLQSFPASGSFAVSQFFASGSQIIGASASASVFPKDIQDWLPSGLTGWISLQSKGLSRSSPTPQFESSNSSALSFLYGPAFTSILDYWKTIALTIGTFLGIVMSLLFNMLSRFVIAFLEKHLLISWLRSLSTVILEPKKRKSVTVSIVSPSIYHEVMGLDAMILVFWMLSFKASFFTLLFHLHQDDFSSSSLSAIRMVSSAYPRLLIFLSEVLIPAYASFILTFHMLLLLLSLFSRVRLCATP